MASTTAILRQNKAIDYEAPFLFLVFGQERADLLDTGATASPDFFPAPPDRRRAHRHLARTEPSRRLRTPGHPHAWTR